ncbi:hypothetical protein J4459_02950 [Candidatus Woesearchaeota archaeon]|nr:hypothetical protein [Candidatus Woesearchaeota archaeon]
MGKINSTHVVVGVVVLFLFSVLIFVPSNGQNEFTGEVVGDSCQNNWGCDRAEGYCVEGRCQDRFPSGCEDTDNYGNDNSENIYVKGTKSMMGAIRTGDWGWYEMQEVGTDYCISSKVLAEYHCERGDVFGVPREFERITCPYGTSCRDGTCSRSTSNNLLDSSSSPVIDRRVTPRLRAAPARTTPRASARTFRYQYRDL